jgi:ribosomal protein L3 glutamine methyltransferase
VRRRLAGGSCFSLTSHSSSLTPHLAILAGLSALGVAVTSELATIVDFIRYGASRFSAAGLTFGHSHDNPIDEATHLVLASLHLPPDIPPAYGAGRLTAEERANVLALIERRVIERLPVAYLVGETWFAGLKFKSDRRALVPRSPIAELIESGFAPWLDERHIERALDLCTGSGCIGIAMAEYNPDWQVDIVDISDEALSLARENIVFQHVDRRVEAIQSDLFAGVKDRRYDLIVSNPPYVTDDEYEALPGEYAHEPKLGLTSGADGLDLCLRMLDEAADQLTDDGLLIVEVGESEHALAALLPEVPFIWIEFKVGQMGVFALERRDLIEHAPAIRAAAASRRAG